MLSLQNPVNRNGIAVAATTFFAAAAALIPWKNILKGYFPSLDDASPESPWEKPLEFPCDDDMRIGFEVERSKAKDSKDVFHIAKLWVNGNPHPPICFAFTGCNVLGSPLGLSSTFEKCNEDLTGKVRKEMTTTCADKFNEIFRSTEMCFFEITSSFQYFSCASGLNKLINQTEKEKRSEILPYMLHCINQYDPLWESLHYPSYWNAPKEAALAHAEILRKAAAILSQVHQDPHKAVDFNEQAAKIEVLYGLPEEAAPAKRAARP